MPVFIVFNTRTVPGPYMTDHVTSLGCDGIHHAENVELVLEDDEGMQVDGEHLRHRILGLCDGSCEEGKKEPKGSFVCYSDAPTTP